MVMANRDQFNTQQFIDKIPGTGGIISTIAERVGCAWHTAKKYIDTHPTVNQAYQNEKRRVDDKAVSNVFMSIAGGDLETSKWWIKMKMGDEFHTTEHQIVSVNWDDNDRDSD